MQLATLINLNAALVFAAVACFVAIRRPPAPLFASLFMTQCFALLWITGEVATQLASDLAMEQVGIALVYGGSYGLCACWWVLAFRFAERHGLRLAWATPAVIWAPSVVAFAGFLAAATNPLHGQFLTPVLGGRNEYHWLWWLFSVPAYGMMTSIAVGYALLFRHFENAPLARRQSAMMFVAMAPVLLANTAYTLAPIDWPFDISILGGLVSAAVFVYGCYYGTLYDLSFAVMRDLWNRDITALMIVDANDRLVYANQRTHTLLDGAGLKEGDRVEPVVRSVLRPVDLESSPFSLWTIRRKLEQGPYFGAPYRTIGGDRSERHWLSAHAIAQPGKRAEVIVIRIHDVTHLHRMEVDRRAIEDRLTQADRLRSLGVLSAGIAHEVNNPVGSALLAAQFGKLALEAERDDQRARCMAQETLDTVIEQTQRAARVTRSMLRFAREEGSEPVVMDLREVVDDAQQFTNELARLHGAYVDIEPCDDEALARINPTEMEQVLVNLIHNAITSGKAGRHVCVEIQVATPHAVIIVSDDGDGMTAEQLERAFEPFYTSRSGSKGTGLGLSVVHGIVTDSGGEVWLESELGIGTRAVVQLPLAQREDG